MTVMITLKLKQKLLKNARNKLISNEELEFDLEDLHGASGADWSNVFLRLMSKLIHSRTFCLFICSLKNIKIRIYKTIILSVVLYGCETWSLDTKGETQTKDV
jgi:hypothetical protein